MSLVNLIGAVVPRALDTNADPSNAALMYVYKAGTTTAVTTYSDEAGTTANAHPVVSDSSGAFGDVYVGNEILKVDIQTSLGVSLPGYPIDDVRPIGNGSLQLDTRAEGLTTDIPTGLNWVQTSGYATVGDGGGGLYERVVSEPSHPGKFQSNDGAWFELVANSEGPNVKQFGAVGDGTADDSTAIANAWAYAISLQTQTASQPGGAILYFPQGDYLITANNVFGDPGYTGQFFWPTIRGAGRGATILRFRPTTGDNAFSDDIYALFDGGDGTTQSDFKPLRVIMEHLALYPETDNLTTGDEIWIWRQDGQGGQQNFRMNHVEVRGPGTIASGAVRSGLLDNRGAVNGSENYFLNCTFFYLSHLIRNENPQAVDNVFIECDAWVIHDHFFVIDNGALEYRIHGGSWIWADTADVNPQYLFKIDSSGGTNPGTGNLKANISFKPEMRNAGAALVEAEDAGGAVFIAFSGCSFAGGGISGSRDVTSLHANKVVTFTDCTIPDAFAFNFLAPNTLIGSLHWSVKNLGNVMLDRCAITADISENITQVGSAGRVIANDCWGLTGSSVAAGSPVNFDSNPFNGGTAENTPRVKVAVGVPTAQNWSPGETYTINLPYGARLQRVRAHRPGVTGAGSATMTLADGDGTLATDTGAETDGYNIDFSPTDVEAMVVSRTTTNQRTLTLTGATFTGTISGAIFMAEYF